MTRSVVDDAGDLKKLLVQETSLQPSEMRLLFRGKQKDDSEWLHVAGVKDKAKIILVEDPASRERRIEAMRKQEQVAKACKAVDVVRSEVDKLAGKVSAVPSLVFRLSRYNCSRYGLRESIFRADPVR